MTADTDGKTNSMEFKVHGDFKIERLHCVDHNIQLAAKLAGDVKNCGLDADGIPIQEYMASVGNYRLSTQAAQTLSRTLQQDGELHLICWK
jgi:hypothetical protein